jgi:hypothetical protein
MTKLNVQRHEKTKSEDGISHLILFSVHEEDLDVTEDVYELGAYVRVSYKTPTREIDIEGVVKGFEFALDHADPYAECVLMLQEEDNV